MFRVMYTPNQRSLDNAASMETAVWNGRSYEYKRRGYIAPYTAVSMDNLETREEAQAFIDSQGINPEHPEILAQYTIEEYEPISKVPFRCPNKECRSPDIEVTGTSNCKCKACGAEFIAQIARMQ